MSITEARDYRVTARRAIQSLRLANYFVLALGLIAVVAQASIGP